MKRWSSKALWMSFAAMALVFAGTACAEFNTREEALAALEKYNHMIESEPGYAMLHTLRGDAYYALGKKREALAAYRLARASDPGGETDQHLLDLKISELAANLPGAQPTAAAATASPAGSK